MSNVCVSVYTKIFTLMAESVLLCSGKLFSSLIGFKLFYCRVLIRGLITRKMLTNSFYIHFKTNKNINLS